MGFWDKVFSKGKLKNNTKLNYNVSQKGYEPNFTAFGSNILYSDIVYSALRFKAEFFGKLQPEHIRENNGQTEKIKDGSIARLLRNPNDFQTTYDFLTQAYFMREKDDNCFIYPDYYTADNGARMYTGLYILLPSMTPLIIQDESGKLFIKFQFVNPGREVIFPYADVIHWRKNWEDNQFLGGGRYAGLANADLLTSLEAYHTSKQAVAEAAKLGCYLDGIIKVNSFLSDDPTLQEQRNKFIQDLQQNKSGIGVLDQGSDYINIQRNLKMVDSATLKEIKENVLLHTGVTIDLLTCKFSIDDKNAFYERHIEGAALSLGQAMSKCFFSQWQTSHGDRVVLYPHKIALMSMQEITQFINAVRDLGAFSLDEIRAMAGYEPLTDGQGSTRPRSFNNLDGQDDTPATDVNDATKGAQNE